MKEATRREQDALGMLELPAQALWGAATQRALVSAPISGWRFPASFVCMLGRIKACAAKSNAHLGLLDAAHATAIEAVAKEIAAGAHSEAFPLDVFQTGSGTSINMNANEVIANLANRKLGGTLGVWDPIHPNDHVNRCQSSNDVIPSTIHLTTASEIERSLLPALHRLQKTLQERAQAFAEIPKTGRTHLQDAMPMTMGQQFSGFARQIDQAIVRLARAPGLLGEIALGGTAVGTGRGAHPDFAQRTCEFLSHELSMDIRPASDSCAALSSHGPCVEVSGALKALATSLIRIAEDIRLMASGPRLGLGELILPTLQPGSSIMPGKINPVIPEIVCQVGTQVIANDLAVTIGAQAGHLQLNTQLPVIAVNLLTSITLLTNASQLFAERCLHDIRVNETACAASIEQSLALATALVPKIGYARAAEIANTAAASGRTIREVALAEGIADAEELEALLDAKELTQPGI